MSSELPGSAAPVAICAQGISKAYRLYNRPIDRLWESLTGHARHHAVHALRELSFTVNKGECMGIIGANGAGKTTLLSILTGILAPSTGYVDVFGRVSAILGMSIGILPQYTGRYNIRNGLIARGVPRELWLEKETQIIEFSELAEVIDNPVNTYSTGMTMRLGFSIAHAVEPEILIIDEALSVGDARFVFKCQKRIRSFIDNGGTLLFVSHDTNIVSHLCQSAILLDKGNLINHGPIKDVLHQYRLMYFGDASAKSKQAVEHREFGSGDMRVVSVELPGASRMGGDVWEMRQGETLRVQVTLHTSKRIAQPGVGVVLNSGYRNRITGYSTVNYGRPLRSIEPGEFTFEYRMPFFAAAGSYTFDVIIADMSTTPPTLLHQWEDLCKIQLRWDHYSIPGPIDAGGEIEFDGFVYSHRAERARRQQVAENAVVASVE